MPNTGRKLNSKDLLVMLLYLPGVRDLEGEPISGKTRLMKMVFLFEKELYKKFRFDKQISTSDLPQFSGYDYGPFTSQIYEDIEFLRGLQYLDSKPEEDEQEAADEVKAYFDWGASVQREEAREYQAEKFFLTDRGKRFARERLMPRLTQNQVEALKRFKQACTKATLRQILKYVYTKYPKYGEKSKIKDQFI